MSTFILYGPPYSYFLRAVRLLLQFKGIQHQVTKAPWGEEIPAFTEAHRKLHPFKRIPVLIHGDLVLPETLAIAHYVEAQPGPSFMPGNAEQQANIISLANMISLYLHKALVAELMSEFRFPKGEGGKVRYEVVNEKLPNAKAALLWLSTCLEKGLFVVGEQFTLADAYLIPMLDYLDQMPEPYNLHSAHKEVCAYIEYHRNQYYCEGVLGKPV